MPRTIFHTCFSCFSPQVQSTYESKMLLHFPDPSRLKTRKVVYEETYYARDSGTLEQLKELSSKRKAIEESINGSSHITAAIAREMAGGVTSPILQDIQRVERYLPHLENLIQRVAESRENQQIIQWTVGLRIRWTSPLSGYCGHGLGGPKYFRIDDLRYELSMMLFLYGALLRERASEVLSSGDLIESAAFFKRAGGVYQHLAEGVLPGLQSFLPVERPPEATVSMASIMSMICLAEAQAVTVRKAEDKATSGGLLAKLHYGVVQILDEASALIRSRATDWNDVSDRLRQYISLCSALHEARSQKYIAHDLKQQEQLGVAIGVLRHAMNRIHRQKTPGEDWRSIFRQEVDSLAEMLRKFEHENDFIWRNKLPLREELPILEGRKIVNPTAYQPFGLDREFVFVT